MVPAIASSAAGMNAHSGKDFLDPRDGAEISHSRQVADGAANGLGRHRGPAVKRALLKEYVEQQAAIAGNELDRGRCQPGQQRHPSPLDVRMMIAWQ